MTLVLSLIIGLLFAAATYCLLRRNLMRVLIGILLLGHAVNLLLLSASDPLSRLPAILGKDGTAGISRNRGPTAAGTCPDRHRDRLRSECLHPRARPFLFPGKTRR